MYKGPEWFVDDINGNDNNDGSQSSPFQNIQHAITKVASGDTLILLPGAHGESDLHLGQSGSGGDPDAITELHFRGSTGDYRDVKIAGNWQGRLFSIHKGVFTFKHITFTEGRASSGQNQPGGGAFMLWNDADVEFVNCHFWKNESEHGGDNQGFNGGGAVAGYDIKRLVF